VGFALLAVRPGYCASRPASNATPGRKLVAGDEAKREPVQQVRSAEKSLWESESDKCQFSRIRKYAFG
jgi:hypothetical protein